MKQDQKRSASGMKTLHQKVATLVVGLIGRISSGNSAKANAVAYNGVEFRDMRIITPYGVAYCPADGVEVQIINNDGNIPAILGAYDPNRPALQPGQFMLYSGTTQLLMDSTGIKAIKGDIIINIL